ncbi:non-specific lipid-transfer protein-like protein At2g13820 [Prunus avium]|uniref:Non-specific lipid-transfer protein-like protein At2g13820 n=1 Tax=Prunus avium TaxID=42229 RepID=A0A6P5TTC4_PRUAV|nr:non-specific lipid-transfer protein-like protein At2g13820 [Prunus avium]
MELFKAFRLITIPITLLIISLTSINGQISTPCTASMISNFTPCINYITGSSSNGTSPTQSCCSSIKSLMGTGTDCACLLITASVPFQLPINRTLALSLPRACNVGGVPLQCKASASPLAAPGPALLGPTPPPTASSPLSPRASKAVAEAPAPQSGTVDDLQPTSPSVESEAPTKSPTGSGRLTPSASASTPSYVSPPSLLLIILGLVVYKSY